jgi:hypothetical protein
VQEFRTSKTVPAKLEANARVLDDFVLRLGGPDLERTTTQDGRVTEPVTVRGDGVDAHRIAGHLRQAHASRLTRVGDEG